MWSLFLYKYGQIYKKKYYTYNKIKGDDING